MPRALATLAVLFAACSSSPKHPADAAPLPAGLIARIALEVDLGGYVTKAELAYPAEGGPHGNGPFPVVLLLAGNGPHDMDVTMGSGASRYGMFAMLSDALAARGFAVVRSNKRFVNGPGKFDARFWREQNTRTFTDDAGKVLDAALAQPTCDRKRIAVFGWSEGTAVGAELAVRRGDVDALVLQGAVSLPWRETVRYWIEGVGASYARGYEGSSITSASLKAALRGKGGMVAKLGASFFADPASMGTGARVSPLLDTNGDGELDSTEIELGIERILDFAFSQKGNVWIYAEGRTVPPVTDQAARLAMPVLVLQGEHDASTPAHGIARLSAAFAKAGNARVEVRMLPGMGHTLGPAASPIDDLGRAPDAATYVGVAEWLAANLAR